MAAKDKKSQPERDDTDKSLRFERERSDDEYSNRQASIEEEADAAVQKARGRADEVLRESRQNADARMAHGQASAQARQSISRERAHEDVALLGERATADGELRDERAERQRALAALLQTEREATNSRLLIERASADDGLAARDRFMAMVSHDSRALLGGIALQASMLKRDAAETEAGGKALQAAVKIQRFTARLTRLIDDLLDLVSIEAGVLRVDPTLQDATATVRESLEAFQPLASVQNLSLDMEIRGDSLMAKLDHERILQVLANLLTNAIKFTPAGGGISLRLEPVGQDVRFSVVDTGSGIPRHQLEEVFQRFWQARSEDRRGLGLGLSISKGIVEAHGGRIWAESQPGKGSTFSFTLPGAFASPT
ncbi:HAMP domain-containing sensor histidine kinase [Myxococcus sp. SDU36]|uniref:sensor histidine kinase n=1 Tax=Myxococcus sp. SDU36 TaxID=2831967 RepID=UPI002543B227|nr:HAMP domain-containing sensor histidine kinase [Myxococcus sp. SDU36]WIG92888.1 HAMP domain-containing histidine kinase [Myxococcus sp. SDU36]